MPDFAVPTAEETTKPDVAVVPALAMCTEKDCHEPAVAAYSWDWGETGYCCARHQFLLKQAADQIGRTITFHPLAVAPAPLLRDERVQLHAARLAAEDETLEAQKRSLELFKQNEALAAEVRRLGLKANADDADLQQMSAELRRVTEQRDRALADHAKAQDEVNRLKTLNDALKASGSVDPTDPRQ